MEPEKSLITTGFPTEQLWGFLLISARYMNKEPQEKALASLPDYQCMQHPIIPLELESTCKKYFTASVVAEE